MAVRKIVKGFLSELEKQMNDQERLVTEISKASLTPREYDYLYRELLEHPRLRNMIVGMLPVIIRGAYTVLMEAVDIAFPTPKR